MFATFFLLAVGLAPDDWYTFEPESRAFRVALPAAPNSTSNRSLPGPTGQVQLTSARLETADGVYTVKATENPARVDPTTLDEGVRQFAAARQATLGPLKPITVAGNPGREFELTEGSKRSRVRFVAAGGTLFVLSAAAASGTELPPDSARFLESLEIGSATPARTSVAERQARANTEAAEARQAEATAAELAQARAETELARTRAELAQAKAQAEKDRISAEAELDRTKARAERDRARAKAQSTTQFADTPDAAVTIGEADKPDKPDKADKEGDDSKNAGKSAAKKAAPTRVVISRMPKGAKPYADDDLQDLAKPLARERDGFRDVGPAGSVLVGVRVSYIERFGGPKVRSAQPIYRSGTSFYAGRTYGEVNGPVTTIVARPDYAVGGLVMHTGLTVDGFGIVFMKVNGDHLDTNDTYNSPWIGDRKGGQPGEVTTSGGLIVGLQGRARDEVNALGLTSLR